MQMPKTSRRAVLAGAAAAVGGLALDRAGRRGRAAAATGLGDLLPSDPIAHLVRRATFGPTPATLAEAAKLGIAGWLDRQLDPAKIDDAACETLLKRLPLAGADIATVRAKLPLHSYEAFGQLGRATVARAIWSNRQLFEMTAGFWANHLHVAAPSSGIWDSRADYDTQVTRKHAFGRFADMLKASARHPAMLTYLDNRSSTKAHPNENYARELMELHTVGLIYSEADVQAAARLLTGLTVGTAGTYAYNASRHATGAVSVLGFSHPNTTAEGGEAAALAFLDHLAMHPATANRIATKLCVRFVADEAPATLVAKLAKVYLDNGTAIVPVLQALFTSPEFAASAGPEDAHPVRGPGRDRTGARAGPGVQRASRRSTRCTTTWSTPVTRRCAGARRTATRTWPPRGPRRRPS